MQLKELFDKHGSDKASKHHYHKVYETILARYSEPVIWEIGVDAGASLAAWAEAGCTIIGIDLFKRHPMEEVAKAVPEAVLFRHDSTTPFEPEGAPTPDIIIDDGSHFYADQAATLRNFWTHLNKGGTYCIEDIWPHLPDHPWTKRHSDKFSAENRKALIAAVRSFGGVAAVHDLSKETGAPDSIICELRK